MTHGGTLCKGIAVKGGRAEQAKPRARETDNVIEAVGRTYDNDKREAVGKGTSSSESIYPRTTVTRGPAGRGGHSG